MRHKLKGQFFYAIVGFFNVGCIQHKFQFILARCKKRQNDDFDTKKKNPQNC